MSTAHAHHMDAEYAMGMLRTLFRTRVGRTAMCGLTLSLLVA